MNEKIVKKIISSDHGLMASDKSMEEAVLSVLLSEPKTAKLYMSRIQEEYFYDTANMLIFRAIMNLHQADQPDHRFIFDFRCGTGRTVQKICTGLGLRQSAL